MGLDHKVFKRGKFLFGCCGSYRMAQILQYELEIPRNTRTNPKRYVIKDFIPAVKESFRVHGFGEIKEGAEDEGGTFLLGFGGSLYCIYDDFQVAEFEDHYCSIGRGYEFALGSLHSTSNIDLPPVCRVEAALSAAKHNDITVGGKSIFVCG